MRYGFGLTCAAAAGGDGRRPDLAACRSKPLGHMFVAALGEAGILIATAPDPQRARAEVEPGLMAMIDGLASRRAS